MGQACRDLTSPVSHEQLYGSYSARNIKFKFLSQGNSSAKWYLSFHLIHGLFHMIPD